MLRLVWLTPQMDGLFRDSAGERRRFLDRLVVAYDPDHSGRIQAYEQSLRERARLLTPANPTLSEFLGICRRRGIAVQLLLSENTWVFPEKRGILFRAIDRA